MSEGREHFIAGKRFLKEDNLDRALKSFDKAWKEDKENPEYMSYYGMVRAMRAGEIGFGLEFCTRAVKKEFFRAEFYLNLGKVYMAAGNKKGAIKVFKKGLRYDASNEEMNELLIRLGFRNRPVIPVLDRSNPLNKFLGILLRRTIPGLLGKKKNR